MFQFFYIMLDDMFRRRGLKSAVFSFTYLLKGPILCVLINEHFTLFGSTRQRWYKIIFISSLYWLIVFCQCAKRVLACNCVIVQPSLLAYFLFKTNLNLSVIKSLSIEEHFVIMKKCLVNLTGLHWIYIKEVLWRN